MGLPLPAIPPIWRESLVPFEAAHLFGSAEWQGVGPGPR